MYYLSYLSETEIGPVTLVEQDGKLCILGFGRCRPDDAWEEKKTSLLMETEHQLREYLRGERRSFDIPLDPQGTPFQQKVWAELCRIPYGGTATYGEIAKRVGSPNGARAVGLANNRNPIAVIIPCHRVIGASGKLTGYAGGLDRKEFLLRLEQRQ